MHALVLLLLAFPFRSIQEAPPALSFVDVAAERGVVSENAARTQLLNVNGDGWPDIVIGGKPFRILLSKPAPGGAGRSFVEGVKGSGLDDRDHSLLLWGDVNGDSRLDVVSDRDADRGAVCPGPADLRGLSGRRAGKVPAPAS